MNILLKRHLESLVLSFKELTQKEKEEVLIYLKLNLGIEKKELKEVLK